MFRNSRRHRLHQHALGFGIVAIGAYAGCVGDPPIRERDGFGGSSGTSGGSDASGATGGSGKGGKGGGSGQGGSTAGTGNAGGTDNEGGAGAVDGGSAGMDTGGGGEGGEAPEECDSGLVTCPGSAECSTNLDVGHVSDDTVDDCGACGVTCSLTHATSSTCSDGVCEPDCSEGFDDCNAGTANDGCESDLSSPTTCGECGRACAIAGVATAECTDAKCTPTCAPSYFDCSADDGSGDDDGCELYGDALITCGATCESAGSPCEGDQVCNAGVCGDPQGLVKFSVPLTAAGEMQRYGNRFSPNPNLTDSTLVMRVSVPGALAGSLFVYANDGSGQNAGPGVRVALDTLSQGWVDLEIPMGGPNGAFDPVSVYQLTIEIESGSAGPWAEPTVLYVDSIWSTNGLVKDTFDADIELMVTSTMNTVAGSSMTWVAAPTP